jgi:hypothetical protein
MVVGVSQDVTIKRMLAGSELESNMDCRQLERPPQCYLESWI